MKRFIIALALALLGGHAQAGPYIGMDVNKDVSVYAGWQFTKSVGLEVGHFGGVTRQSNVATYTPFALIGGNRFYEQTYTREDVDSNFVRLRGQIAITKTVNAYATLAAHNVRTETMTAVTTVTTTNPPPLPIVVLNSTYDETRSTQKEWVPGVGVGLAFRWGDTPFEVTVGYEQINTPGDRIKSGAVGVRLQF